MSNDAFRVLWDSWEGAVFAPYIFRCLIHAAFFSVAGVWNVFTAGRLHRVPTMEQHAGPTSRNADLQRIWLSAVPQRVELCCSKRGCVGCSEKWFTQRLP